MQLNQSSAASAKQKANTDDEDRETPPDQIITAKRFMTAKKGWGVRARQSVAKGSFILEYTGEICSRTIQRH